MSETNGEMSERRRQQMALYQRGKAVANDVRHKVQQPAETQKEEYGPSDVVAAMFYMNSKTVIDLGKRLSQVPGLEGEVEERVGWELEQVKASKSEPNSDE